ncbi:hypothetical protein FMUAM8_50630 [Nocardia cyriacigeorgica]|nr:hypothetical protein FMUAM8_50630 [Nocardia cyriacigeorgica]
MCERGYTCGRDHSANRVEVAMPDQGLNGPADTDNRGPIAAVAQRSAEDTPLVEESLIEEVSIDGMCGVY